MPPIRLDLIKSTQTVFDQCAQVYLKEDKHWGSDLDIICQYVEKLEEPEVIELGTGHAWHLANLFFLVSTKMKKVVGVDYSNSMLKNASTLLKSFSNNGIPIVEKIELHKANIISLPFVDESFDVAIMLNNTLGNIPARTFDKAERQRKKALTQTQRIIRRSGFLILSVYNSDKLTDDDKYGEVFELDNTLSNLDTFDLVVRYKKTGTPYYSHWFNKSEICGLLYNLSFKIVEVEERRKRIVVVAQKTG